MAKQRKKTLTEILDEPLSAADEKIIDMILKEARRK